MGLMARKPMGSDIDPVEAGVHQAICIRYYDLGTQYMEMFQTAARKVLLMWELPDERITINDKDLPRAISKEYTLSLHKKANLRSDLESWRGKKFTEKELDGFDLDKILKANCMLNVIHNEKGYAQVAAVMPLMKDRETKKSENPVHYFSFDDGEVAIPEGTPEWIANKIKNSDEWASFNDPNYEAPPNDEESPPLDDDPIPF